MTGPEAPATVTVLGLGAMGHAIATAFVNGGHRVTVWNRSPGKADRLVARGAREAATAAEAVRASGLVVVCLLDQAASRDVLRPLAADLRGRVLADLSSDVPQRAREAAAWAADEGIDYLDGTIVVNVPMVGADDALVLYGGPRSAFERHESTLRSLGGATTYLGEDHALPAAYDVAVLDYFWTSMAGLVHAFALARAEGIAAADLAPHLLGNGGLLTSLIPAMAADIDAGTYPGDADNLVMDAAGVEHVLHAAAAHGLDVAVLLGVDAMARRAIALGHGAAGWTATVEAVRRPT
ncbi:NAD(P)-dependent oxidoreductase [Tsukamurella paurometabola]|uniref:2-hydroxy-3-oxopropionate reductase n=1 Tax=Tsukamurella paurometabola TaxID=2061 RepID=A0A3P8K2S4_TSUPA|nr:NAD(P)-binding domain-containing protein [Tsukamurella paurometabola]MBS4100295.1 NAD(P)-dependent oxidoreductase [Tsukamurella paurometabola]UEA82654.1 NAD(P)-binding domain-containing protein [Tsukamurella paurometabola]VDR39719.1 2-hydroxy-3-oxopropionate reductase [Tsukamurella paurometabola]